jgi:NADP-dependent 3-hydroxy acid dehydrogenase YdfG
MTLNNKVVLITGGSSGIGAAIARLFAARGARIVLAARSEHGLQQTVESLPSEAESLVIPTDVGDEAQVRVMVERTISRFGGIDVLVNNAGYGLFKSVTELTAEEFDDIQRVNLRGVFLCAKYVLPHMYEKKSGTVVTISSLAGKNGFPNGGAYCASKFGVMGLMECIFHEARRYDVRVVTIAPGSVDTPFFDGAQMTPPNRGRILQAEDVAETVLLAATLPERALIRELDIRPTNPRGE